MDPLINVEISRSQIRNWESSVDTCIQSLLRLLERNTKTLDNEDKISINVVIEELKFISHKCMAINL